MKTFRSIQDLTCNGKNLDIGDTVVFEVDCKDNPFVVNEDSHGYYLSNGELAFDCLGLNRCSEEALALIDFFSSYDSPKSGCGPYSDTTEQLARLTAAMFAMNGQFISKEPMKIEIDGVNVPLCAARKALKEAEKEE